MSRSNLASVFASAALAFALAFAPLPARAMTAAMPFGGLITVVITGCYDGSTYFYVYDYVTKMSIPLSLQTYSRLNMYYAVMYGNSALGTYTPISGECVLSYYPYIALTYNGIVTSAPLSGMGTSLMPSL